MDKMILGQCWEVELKGGPDGPILAQWTKLYWANIGKVDVMVVKICLLSSNANPVYFATQHW